MDFFPQQLTEQVSDHLRALTVEHLLTMSVGQVGNMTDAIVRERDWVRAFLAWPIEHAPGSTYSYNNIATYMLSAIVQKVSGQKLIDYLERRLFAPLGIRQKHWECCPAGINVGGWGLSLTTESVAKFGQFYLQRGQWKGRQLLPQHWIDAASSARQPTSTWDVIPREAETLEQAIDRLNISSDWHHGYGYQLWRCRHGAYRGDGAYGQFCIVVPRRDLVIVITSHTPNMQGLLDNVWEHLLPGVHDGALPTQPASARLQSELASMAVPAPENRVRPSPRGQRRYSLESNTFGAVRASFALGDQSCVFRLEFASNIVEVHCGIGRWVDNLIDMPDTPPKFISRAERRTLGVAAAAFWEDAHTLRMHWRYYETPNYDVITCRFEGSTVTIEFMSDTVQLSAGKWSEDRPKLRGSQPGF